MKTVVRALTRRRVLDGWGREYLLRRPVVAPGQTYLCIVNNNNCLILRKLLTQEKLMEDWVNDKILDNEFDGINYTYSS